MVKLLKQLIGDLSDTTGGWGKFQQKDIRYFLPRSKPPTAISSLDSSVDMVDNAFLELKHLLQKLQSLEKELREYNPQGVSLLFHFKFDSVLYISL